MSGGQGRFPAYRGMKAMKVCPLTMREDGGGMGRYPGKIFIWFCLCMCLAVTGHARQTKAVYLKGGEVLECQKFWATGDKVNVLVNRDTFLEFSRDEVDMKRTFKAHKRIRSHRAGAGKGAKKVSTE